MSLYALVEYIKYRRKAMSRHGVHSPFVYAFIEQVLQAKNGRSFEQNLQAYVPDGQIINTGIGDIANAIVAAGNTSILITHGIHKTSKNSEMWANAAEDAKVLLSIDLYSMGVLFFRKEFKEKQHFVLKYKA